MCQFHFASNGQRASQEERILHMHTLSITEKYKSISENYTSTITYLELTYHFALFKIRSSIRHPSARSTSQGRKKVLKSRGQEVMWWAKDY